MPACRRDVGMDRTWLPAPFGRPMRLILTEMAGSRIHTLVTLCSTPLFHVEQAQPNRIRAQSAMPDYLPSAQSTGDNAFGVDVQRTTGYTSARSSQYGDRR